MKDIADDKADSSECPICTELPPSQDPGFDHDLKEVLTVEVESSRVVLPKRPACDAVECRFGRVSNPLRVRINGVLAAVYDPAKNGEREFRIEVDRLLRWGTENVIEVQDASGNGVECCCRLVALRII